MNSNKEENKVKIHSSGGRLFIKPEELVKTDKFKELLKQARIFWENINRK